MREILKKVGIFFLVLCALCIVFGIAKNKDFIMESAQIHNLSKMGEVQENGNKCIIQYALPEKTQNGDGIVFFTKGKYVDVYLKGNLIYAYMPGNPVKELVPGNRWNFIAFSEEDGGEVLTLQFYGGKTNHCPPIKVFYGNIVQLNRNIMLQTLIPFLLSGFLFCVGAFFIIIWLIYRKRNTMPIQILLVGCFTTSMGISSTIFTEFLQILVGNSYVLLSIAAVFLFLTVYPMIACAFQYFSPVNKRTQKWHDFIQMSFLILNIVCLFGYMTGLTSVQGFVLLSKIVIWVSGWIIFIIMVNSYQKGKRKTRRKLRIFVGLLFIILVFFFLDFWNYFYGDAVDGAWFTRIGVVFYVIIIASETIKVFMNEIRKGQENEKIKSMAYFDALTRMGNRTAFMNQLREIEKEDYVHYGIAMFDLNNLKVFNDVHGHSAGDYYLIISSEIIQDIFGTKGKIYRIGGDEFCALLKDCSKEEFMKGAKEMQNRVSQLKGPYTREEMSIAYGYQRFHKDLDNDLSSTMERADIVMYQVKESLKKKK